MNNQQRNLHGWSEIQSMFIIKNLLKKKLQYKIRVNSQILSC